MIEWFLTLPQVVGEMIEVLVNASFDIGDVNVNIFGLFTGSIILVIIVAKIVALAIPG